MKALPKIPCQLGLITAELPENLGHPNGQQTKYQTRSQYPQIVAKSMQIGLLSMAAEVIPSLFCSASALVTLEQRDG